MSGFVPSNSNCGSEDELDPRIQLELENLNIYTDEINSLELKLDEANASFRNVLNESTAQLKILAKKTGSALEKSRPYFEAKKYAAEAQNECQKAAIQYQRAFALHQAAKETILLAEKRFLSNQKDWIFDSAWQEMLNHATIKVMEAERQKALNEKEHELKAKTFSVAGKQVYELEQKLSKSIQKATCYFDKKEKFEKELIRLKNHVHYLHLAVLEAKKRYALSLNKLESISKEIHEKRKLYNIMNHNGTEMIPLPEINLDFCDKLSIGSGIFSTSSSDCETDSSVSNKCISFKPNSLKT